ncbi:MAG: sensor histidine kinase [Saccharofermentanales bacterium]
MLVGVVFITITQFNLASETKVSDLSYLKGVSECTNLILNESKIISSSFNNVSLSAQLKKVLRNSPLAYEDKLSYDIFQRTLFSQLYSKQYIHSCYIYFNNADHNFISTNRDGITSLYTFYDNEWFEEYQNSSEDSSNIWSQVRSIKNYSFETFSTRVLTIYYKLYSSGMTKSDGVVVVNLDISHLEKVLSAFIKNYQNVVIVNENREVILKVGLSDLSIEEISGLVEKIKDNPNQHINIEKHAVFGTTSGDLAWTYLLITPRSLYYRVLNLLLIFMTTFLIVLTIIQLIITSGMTRNNYATVMSIIKILESAERNEPFPELNKLNNEYDYIINNVLKTYLENTYYQKQIVEHKYTSQILELLSLQRQINPHFLYNTLHSIIWKSISLTKGPNDVSTMLESLSSMLEYSLREPLQTVSVEDEVNNCICYLNIMNIRYDNKFIVNWELSDNISEFKIMKLSLQPLIENSIIHGFNGKSGKCCIKIKMFEHHENLYIHVTDNGLGIPPEKLNAIRESLNITEFPIESQSKHVGLFNTVKRLHIVYESKFAIKILSKVNFGTSVQISIPAVYKDAQQQ